jgi:hypothetical protein
VRGAGRGRRLDRITRIHDALDDGEQVEGRAGEAIYPRHRHHVAGSKVFQHA